MIDVIGPVGRAVDNIPGVPELGRRRQNSSPIWLVENLLAHT